MGFKPLFSLRLCPRPFNFLRGQLGGGEDKEEKPDGC